MRRPLTAVVAGATVLALAVLVAVASRGTPVWTSLREGSTRPAHAIGTLPDVARARAVLDGRDFVTPDDVRAIAACAGAP